MTLYDLTAITDERNASKHLNCYSLKFTVLVCFLLFDVQKCFHLFQDMRSHLCQAEDRVSKTVSLRLGEGVGAFIMHQKSHLKCEPAPVSHKVLNMLLKATNKSVGLSAPFKEVKL